MIIKCYHQMSDTSLIIWDWMFQSTLYRTYSRVLSGGGHNINTFIVWCSWCYNVVSVFGGWKFTFMQCGGCSSRFWIRLHCVPVFIWFVKVEGIYIHHQPPIHNLRPQERHTQRWFSTSQTQCSIHYKRHSGSIYCRAVVLDCIILYWMFQLCPPPVCLLPVTLPTM